MGAPRAGECAKGPRSTSAEPPKRLTAAVRLRNMLRFRVIGSVEFADDVGRVAQRGPKQRALLAMLLVDVNAVVSRDRLIEGLWGERPPSDVEHALDVQVSALRRTLATAGNGRLARRAPGYVLTVHA